MTRRATQSASRREIGYKVERDHRGLVRHWQATKTSTMVGGYAHLADGEKETRELADGANWYWLRREMKNTILEFVGSEKELEVEAFRMASGGEANWRVAGDEVLRDKLLEILCRWLEAQDLEKEGPG